MHIGTPRQQLSSISQTRVQVHDEGGIWVSWNSCDQKRSIRASKLFLLLPRLLLFRPQGDYWCRKVASDRGLRFARGDWESLLFEAKNTPLAVRRPAVAVVDVNRMMMLFAGQGKPKCPSKLVSCLLHVSVSKGFLSSQGTGPLCLLFAILQKGQWSNGTQSQQMCSSSSQGLLLSWMWTVSRNIRCAKHGLQEGHPG